MTIHIHLHLFLLYTLGLLFRIGDDGEGVVVCTRNDYAVFVAVSTVVPTLVAGIGQYVYLYLSVGSRGGPSDNLYRLQ
jgi:hypothetical protein